MAEHLAEDFVQAHVRTAIIFLRTRCGGWKPLARALKFQQITLSHILGGRVVSASMAFRVARFARVGLDDLLAGKFPPAGTCPHCGHRTEDAAQ